MHITPEHAEDLKQLKHALGAIQKLRARVQSMEAERHEPIAVIGIGCRLPGDVDSPSSYWRMLANGVEAVGDVPPGRWDPGVYVDSRPGTAGTLPTGRAGWISDVDGFDASFFGIAPREARAMDPQQRLILETAWEALEDAGIAPDTLRGSQTGVFVGVGHTDYSRLQIPDQARDSTLADIYALTGNILCIVANRLSYLLDLRGPSMAIDTACSSSLVAVHQAVQSLRRRESSLALVGGINLMLAPETGIALGRLLSPDGRSKFGDAGADGFVRGEGAVIVALKLLSAAVDDGDPIYAVIRGSAVSQDGLTSSLSVPNGVAQQAVIRAALADANLTPEQVVYVEAHGTGTALGDPIEVGALGAVYGKHRPADAPLLVGSVKTNIGHLEAAAGIAGLAKVALSMAAGAIPPSLHFQAPNPRIDFDQQRVRVQAEYGPWPAGHRIAGVSAFGFGGTNAHVILEAAPERQDVPADVDRSGHLLLLSARSEEALRELADRYASKLENDSALDLAALCQRAAVGRMHHEYRQAFVSRSAEDLRESLQAAAAAGSHLASSAGRVDPDLPAKVAFLFTGQGAQYPGMGRHLYESWPVFRDTVDECVRLLEPHLGRSLLDVMFAQHDTPEAALLDRTEYTQPALFVLEYALARLWQSWGVEPAAVAGHSLGEYVAACVAGILSLEDALRLVAVRGQLMGSLPAGGAMAAIFAPEQAVQDALRTIDGCISIAAVNAANHIVISGEESAVEVCTSAFESAGVRVRRLTVSHAFHSPLMDPILDEFEAYARQIAFHAPQIPVVSNRDGTLIGSGHRFDASYLREHLREAVRFAACFERLHAMGLQTFIEVGPAPVLTGMGRSILPESVTFVPSMRSSDELQILKAAGMLYTQGVEVDWRAFSGQRRSVRIDLPTYPWQRERHWFQPLDAAIEDRLPVNNGKHPFVSRELRSPALRERVFEGDLSCARLPFLRDHSAHGAMIFPATGYVEMIGAVARELAIGNHEISELTISEALLLPEEGHLRVQVIIRPEEHRYGFEIVSSSAQDEWRTHASGYLAESTAIGSHVDLEQMRAACQNEIAGDSVYARFETLGMEFGPSFRGLVRLWHDTDTAVGNVSLPVEAGDPSRFIMHPVLLDACLQTIEPLMPAKEGEIFLPIRLEQVAIRPFTGSTAWSRATVQDVPDSSTLVCSIEVFDSDGTAIASIGRLVLRRATRAALEAVTGRRSRLDAVYEINWRDAPREIPPEITPGRWLLMADADGVGEGVAQHLIGNGHQVDLVWPDTKFANIGPGRWTVNPAGEGDFRRLLVETLTGEPLTGIAFLWSANKRHGPEDGPLGPPVGLEGALNLVKAIVHEQPVPIWFVTRGAQCVDGAIEAPQQAAIWGFARSIAREHPALRARCIDLDANPGGDLISDLALELQAADDEDAVVIRSGRRLVGRLQPLAQTETLEQPVRLQVTEPGSFDGLQLTAMTRTQPGPGEVEIRVRATGLNFRDVLMTLGLYPDPANLPGSECAGTISAVGTGVEQWQVGDDVVALVEGCFSTYAIADAALVARRPRSVSVAEAAGIPGAYVTAAYALRHLAQIQPGMRVLIHAATGGVGLAALQIARAAGAEVFATAGSDEKRAYLRSLGVEHIYDSRSVGFADSILAATAGVGVDIVLNSLTGELIPESLRSVRDGGCFLEIGKRGIWTSDEVAALGRSLAYHVIYMGGVYENQSEIAGQLLHQVCEELDAGRLAPLPVRTFSLARSADAFRFMGQTRHIGKIVVTQEQREPLPHDALVRPDVSYLITGGTGGLGLSVARWLTQRGARHLVLVSRSAPSEAACTAVAELEELGVQVHVVQADVGTYDEIASVLERVDAEMPELAGVVHAAGALDDGVVMQQTWPRFVNAFHGKAEGAWNLHRLTLDRQLDFFVVFSAGAALIGLSGQSNYASANAALDAVAHWRRVRGLPATSFDWGPWSEVGMAAGLSETFQQRLAEQGLQSISPETGVRALEGVLVAGSVQVAVLPADWEQFARSFAPEPPPSIFRDLARAITPSQSDHAASNQFVEQLGQLPSGLRRNAMLRFIRGHAGHVLGVATPDAISPTRPLQELGLDSLMAVDLRNVLNRTLGLSLPATLLFDCPTLDALTDYLLGILSGSEVEAESVKVASNGHHDDAFDVAALTDDEAEALLALELSDR